MRSKSHGRRLFAVVTLYMALAGCRDAPDYTTIQGLPYSFPREAVDGLVRPDDGMLYVRLKESPSHYILILDARADRAERERGHPIVSGINLSRYAETETIAAVGGPVICRDMLGLNCGIRIDDSGVKWSVLFNDEDIAKVPSITKMALRDLQRYRVD